MAPIVPDPKRIRSFRDAGAFEAWLRANHDRADEIWLRVYKKGSVVPSIDCAQALDVVLCWGWSDGIRKSYDAQSFLQRYTPRRPKSIWSQINRDHVARLIKAGRMTEHGQRQVDLAKADGRWDAAYAPIRSIRTVPPDLEQAIHKNKKALETFRTLSRANVFALTFRTNNMKTAAGREKKIKDLVAMLARGETIVPQKRKS